MKCFIFLRSVFLSLVSIISGAVDAPHVYIC